MKSTRMPRLRPAQRARRAEAARADAARVGAPARAATNHPASAGRLHQNTDSHPADAGHGALRYRVYVRASTRAQDESVEQQVEVAERDLRALGVLAPDAHLPRCHAPEAGVYADDGVSAWEVPPLERPAARAMIADLEQHKRPLADAGIVWIWAQSRYLRAEHGPRESITEIARLEELGWVLYVHRERRRLELTGPNGLLNVITAAVQGEKDSEHSREKSHALLRVKRRQVERGIWMGGFPPPGYERWVARLEGDSDVGPCRVAEWVAPLAKGCRNGWHGTVTLLRPTPAADAIRGLFALVADGKDGAPVSINEIHRRLNSGDMPSPIPGHDWCRASIQSLLTNPTYLAVQHDAEGIEYAGAWEPLVDRALFQRVQARIAANRERRRGITADFPLSGLITCAKCGSSLCGESHRWEGGCIRYYKVTSPWRVSDPKRCTACARRVRADVVEDVVITALEGLASHEVVQTAVAMEQQRRAEGESSEDTRREILDQRDAAVQQKIDNLLAALATHGPAVSARGQRLLSELEAEAARLRDERDALESPSDGGLMAWQLALPSFRDVWNGAGLQERRDLVSAFVSQIELDIAGREIRIAVRPPRAIP